MALVALYGSKRAFIGPTPFAVTTVPAVGTTTMDAANEAIMMIGQIETSDGGSHTINTTGSSSIFWRTGAVTFANAGTTVKAGIATVLTTAGPPARATHASDVITFSVSRSMTGGGGGITANAAQNHVPDSGTMTIANGDVVAICIQMTARAGVDSVVVNFTAATDAMHRPAVTQFVGGAYGASAGIPNAFITFSDGATGWIYGGSVFNTILPRTFNSGSATKEYGQLYQLPFPANIYGLYGWVDPDADFDVVLYSDPLGSPVAEKTVSIDANTVQVTQGRRFQVMFSSPYTTTADQLVGAVFKPGASNISAYYRTLSSAGHRASDPWGTSGYGIARASGAFAAENSNLDNYEIGLLAGAFDAGGSAGGGISRARAASGF